MGIYINGMEMPKGCYECPLMDGEYGNCKVGATGLYDPYMDDCPLTEVPEPHGRLIDADALADDLETDGKEFGEEIKLNCASWLRSNATPTIIERSNNA